MVVSSTNGVTQSQAASALGEPFAVERLKNQLRDIRNESLSFAEEPGGFSVSAEAVEWPDAASPASVPPYDIEKVKEGAESRIAVQDGADVYDFSAEGRDRASSLLG